MDEQTSETYLRFNIGKGSRILKNKIIRLRTIRLKEII